MTAGRKPGNAWASQAADISARAVADREAFALECDEPEPVQRTRLEAILARQELWLGERRWRSVDDFRQQAVPRAWEEIESDFRALYETESPDGPREIRYMARTAGTTGMSKSIPVTQGMIDAYLRHNRRFFAFQLAVDPSFAYHRMHQIGGASTPGLSPGGIGTGLISGFLGRETIRDLDDMVLSTPKEIQDRLSGETRARTMRCFAAAARLSSISGVTTFNILDLCTGIIADWRWIRDCLLGTRSELAIRFQARGLETGWIGSLPEANPFRIGRRRLQELAELEFPGGSDSLPSALWPDLSAVFCLTNSTAGSHLPELRRILPGVRMRCSSYLASEATLNLCMEDEFGPGGGPVSLDSAFLEFMDDSGRLHGVHELDVGGVYEVLVTQENGLFRYLLKDRVEVCGRWRRTPAIRFLGKRDLHLNVIKERVTQDQITLALNTWKQGDVGEWVVWVDEGRRYRLAIEDDASRVRGSDGFDTQLQRVNLSYGGYRQTGAIAPPLVEALPVGGIRSFWRAKESGGAGEQLKISRIIHADEGEELLRLFGR